MRSDRTTAQKALKTLVDSKLVSREQRNLERGGYIYLYKVLDREEIKRKMIKDIDLWTDSAKKGVKSW
jgi:predicted transcriptional regulator